MLVLVYCIVATKIILQEVKYPNQLLVVHKNRTAFVFYEMNNSLYQNDRETTPEAKLEENPTKKSTAKPTAKIEYVNE